ncbi:MAG: hypothetical protein EXQ98_02185 [Alphaproteobacteria bacterium]|nr:hypothetical protein [Alphaproteobacteria bacterium]
MKCRKTTDAMGRRSARKARRRDFALCCVILILAVFSTPFSMLLAPRPAAAQEDVLRIAAVVNEDVISIFDLAVRLAVSIRSSGFDDTPQLRRQLAPQVLRAMIDERLQGQEAKRLTIVASEKEINDAIAQIEAQNKWEEGSFDGHIKEAGLQRDVIIEQIRTEIAWGKIVRRRFSGTVSVSDKEVDSAVARIEANRGRPENRVAEIFLPLDGPNQENAVRRTAEDLVAQLRTGGAFPAVARQFSKGASANQGGEIGWVVAGQLSPEIENGVIALEPGQISDPIRTFDGYYIVTVIARRLALTGATGDPTFKLSQVVIEPGTVDDAAARKLVSDVKATRDCARFQAAAKGRASALSGDLGMIVFADLPAELRAAIQSLRAGQTTASLPYEGGTRIIMVCERNEAETVPQRVDREAVQRDLGNRKLDLAARRYLRDLRRAAFIDIRI